MITVNGRDGNPFDQNSMDGMQGRYIKTYHRLALSGNYATGGDTLDFTNGGVNPAVPPLVRGIEGVALKESAGSAASCVGTGCYFEPIGTPGPVGAAGVTALNAWKLKAFQAGGAEQAAGAYTGFSASPATDTLELEVTWLR
jgi:hypothetical protein